MKHIVKRYSLIKSFIATGELTVEEDGDVIMLSYRDLQISVSGSKENNPILALQSLRQQIENNNQSILSINGCRIDTAYISTPNYSTYVIDNHKPSSRSIGLFEPTSHIDKLCTYKEHEAAYEEWIQSILAK